MYALSGQFSLWLCAPIPGSPRKSFSLRPLQRLAQSLRDTGQEQAVQLVELPPGSPTTYRIHDGERRFRAATMIGWATLDAVLVRVASDGAEKRVHQAIANACRENLNWIELAAAMREARDELGKSNEEIGRMFGCTALWVYEHLRCISLDPRAIALIDPIKEDSPLMKVTVVYELSRLPKEGDEQFVGARHALEKNLTLTAVKRYVKERLKALDPQRDRSVKPSEHFRTIRRTVATTLDRVAVCADIGAITMREVFRARDRKDAEQLVEDLGQCIEQLTAIRASVSEASGVKV